MNVLKGLFCRMRAQTPTIKSLEMERIVEDESGRERSKGFKEVYELLMAPTFLTTYRVYP